MKDEVTTVAHPIPSYRVGARIASLSLACVLASPAQAEDWPLSLTLSQDVKRDSNFSRNDTNQAETISTTSAGVGFSKDYGRQSYRANGVLGMQRFSHFSELKNDSKDANLSISSGLGSNWNASLSGAYSQSLNPIQNNNAGPRVVRNIRTFNDQKFSLQYGNGGRWSLVGLLDSNRVSYSEDAFRFQNVNQNSQGLRANYNSSDLLQFGIGGRLVRSRYPLNNNERLTDRNLDFSVSSQVSGLSNFEGVISRRQSQYASTDRKISGWTGSASWGYTPHGLVSYNVGLSRSTGADRYRTNVLTFEDTVRLSAFEINFDTVTTSLNLGASYQATGKLSFGASYNYNKYDLRNAQTLNTQSASFQTGSSQTTSHGRNLGLSANYAALRNLRLGCSYSSYKQTQDAQRQAFTGHVFGCNASYTLD